MKRLIIFFILVKCCLPAYNQIIRGIVRDQYTDIPITYAVVYFNGTFVGTQSDSKGYFELDISKNNSMPLTISALGYYSVILTDLAPDRKYQISLVPKIFELKEVVIIAKDPNEREKNLKLFKKEFLGSTLNSWNCEITNEDDITLISVNDTLKAFASKPIIIDNKSLGYRITYYLDNFKYSRNDKHLLFYGNYFFNEYLTFKGNQQKRYERRREEAYIGSRMHFFRALWENKLESSGFIVEDSTFKKILFDKLVIQTEDIASKIQSKYLNYKGILFIIYHKWSVTTIELKKEHVYFDKTGFFDPFGISWEGDLVKQRIGDLLPFEYSIK
jgi:CarboxypepD_reg-like domain